jgi:isopropylmalate/homocitrate/citramalate synthase
VPPLAYPRRVRVVEVGPRDGLQNEPEIVPLETKVAFIEDLADAGLSAIEVGSFVRPDRVPQMADTDAVVRRLRDRPGVSYIALVPNQRGLERAVAAGIRTIAVFTAASEAFAQANIGMGIDASIDVFRAVAASAREAGVHVRGYISTAWWCPFSGRVDPETVRRVALDLLAAGCDDVDVADTIGAATPAEVSDTLERLMRDIPADRLAVHFHDTRGTALANVLASLAMGIATVDASAGGLGGCPFAPGALGNLASEDLVYMLHGMGIDTSVDLEALRAASARIEAAIGRPLPSRYLRAGPLRPRGGTSRSS